MGVSFLLNWTVAQKDKEPLKLIRFAWLGDSRPDADKPKITMPETLGVEVLPKFLANKSSNRDAVVDQYWGNTGEHRVVRKSSTQHYQSRAWTGITQPTVLAVDAKVSAQGAYSLEVPTVGKVAVEVGPEQDFLPALKVVEPQSPTTANGQAVTIKWEPVEGAIAYALSAANDSEYEFKYWYAPEPWELMVYEKGPEAALKAGKVFGPDVHECTLPAGIFGKAKVNVVAFSASKGADSGNIPFRTFAISGASLDVR